MNKNKVVIYTSSLCGFCYKAKSLLKKKNIVFEEIDVDFQYEKKVEMINKSKGRTSVPQIFFGDKHIGGCDDLFELEEKDELNNLLKI
ncbi:MAG: glutaredoxin 3 [Alphaproteobacteria bacterium]|nr:glutaredoxin 3 [Alphaproteobacteria bacterium]